MILSNRQATRFLKLFNLLMDFAIGIYVDTHEGHESDAQKAKVKVGEDVFDLIWGVEGDLDIIDCFADENPAHLNRTDLRAVLAWRDAVFSTFPMVRRDGDTYLLYGGHGFVVRGITHEADAEATFMPCLVTTVILPFDGLITYGTVLIFEDDLVTQGSQETFEDALDDAIDEGRLARSERQYLRMLPAAEEREVRDAEEEGDVAHPAVEGERASVGQHRGALAGMDWDEREQAIERYWDDLEKAHANSLAIKYADTVCNEGSPAYTLEDHFGRFSKKLLVECATMYKLGGRLSKMSKRELVRLLSDHFRSDPYEAIRVYARIGANEIGFVRDVVRADGRLKIVASELSGLTDVPFTKAPYLVLYHDGEDYLAVIPDDICVQLKDVDFDEVIERARHIDALVRRFGLLVDLKGVLLSREVVDFMHEVGCNDEEDEHAFFDTVLNRCGSDSLPIRQAEVPDLGDIIFFHSTIADASDLDEDEVVHDPAMIFEILDEREGKVDRPLSDFGDHKSVLSYVCEKRSYQELCALLDEHVPDGENDYTYADDVVDGVRHLTRPSKSADALFKHELAMKGGDLDRYVRLAMELVNDVPQWANNGWSGNEMAKMYGLRAQAWGLSSVTCSCPCTIKS